MDKKAKAGAEPWPFTADSPPPPPQPPRTFGDQRPGHRDDAPLVVSKAAQAPDQTGGPVLSWEWDEADLCWRWKYVYPEDDAGGGGGVNREDADDGAEDLGACSFKNHKGLVWELMPMIWALRCFLMMPVSISSSGVFTFRLRSWTALLSLAVWVVLVAGGYFLILYEVAPLMRSGKHYHLWDLVSKYAGAISTCYIFVLPYTCWAQTPFAVSMIEQWQAVERLIASLHGNMHVPSLRTLSWAYTAMAIVVPAAIETLSALLTDYDELWMVPLFVHAFGFCMLSSCFWDLCCRGLAAVAVHQARCIDADFTRLGVEGLHGHRRIWLGTVQVVRLLQRCWGRTHVLLFSMAFITFVSLSFVMTHFVVDRAADKRFFWVLVMMICAGGMAAFSCNSAQVLTDALRNPTRKALLAMSFTHRDKQSFREIMHFLQDIQLEAPRVTVCRLGTLDRSSILSFFALANTYICVVSQFAISDESSATNFTEDPFDMSYD